MTTNREASTRNSATPDNWKGGAAANQPGIGQRS